MPGYETDFNTRVASNAPSLPPPVRTGLRWDTKEFNWVEKRNKIIFLFIFCILFFIFLSSSTATVFLSSKNCVFWSAVYKCYCIVFWESIWPMPYKHFVCDLVRNLKYIELAIVSRHFEYFWLSWVPLKIVKHRNNEWMADVPGEN